MRLWDPSILQEVPAKKLSVLHMALCRVRSRPWGKPTPAAFYYNMTWDCLAWYHSQVVNELQRRGWRMCLKWLDWSFRGMDGEPASGPHDYSASFLDEFRRINFDSVEKQAADLGINFAIMGHDSADDI